MEDKNKIKELEKRINELETSPYRCEVCGKPTNGWIRVLFCKTYYCKDHFPSSYTGPLIK